MQNSRATWSRISRPKNGGNLAKYRPENGQAAMKSSLSPEWAVITLAALCLCGAELICILAEQAASTARSLHHLGLATRRSRHFNGNADIAEVQPWDRPGRQPGLSSSLTKVKNRLISERIQALSKGFLYITMAMTISRKSAIDMPPMHPRTGALDSKSGPKPGAMCQRIGTMQETRDGHIYNQKWPRMSPVPPPP